MYFFSRLPSFVVVYYMYCGNFFHRILVHSGLIQREGAQVETIYNLPMNITCPSWASSKTGGRGWGLRGGGGGGLTALKSSLPTRQVLLKFLCQPLETATLLVGIINTCTLQYEPQHEKTGRPCLTKTGLCSY